ncbi:unnamed protein product [Didymodactylos carnosus]|uniref:VASt domain-containing protein n=1 Tax=Didymodactylos carnosus TaxID=1234261 RepID=A0A8S2D1N2_9BILA|nr:unnamed protein product [Didymodactylos carnosus]CAF3605986.1 unnamed protein product [Didymodactylos carnosus]
MRIEYQANSVQPNHDSSNPDGSVPPEIFAIALHEPYVRKKKRVSPLAKIRRRHSNDHATEWTLNSVTNNRERVVTSKIPFVSVLGNSTISSTEKQIIRNERKHSYYIVDNEIYNAGVKFGDAFYVLLRYCLVQTSVSSSSLRITAEVRYLKSVLGFMKSVIEKHAIAAVQVSLQDLDSRISLVNELVTAPPQGRRLSRFELVPPTIKEMSFILDDIEKIPWSSQLQAIFRKDNTMYLCIITFIHLSNTPTE